MARGGSTPLWETFREAVEGAPVVTLRPRAIDADFAFQARTKMNDANTRRILISLENGRPNSADPRR